MITVVPPSVQPSLGHIALIVGVAIKKTMADYRLKSLLPKKKNKIHKQQSTVTEKDKDVWTEIIRSKSKE